MTLLWEGFKNRIKNVVVSSFTFNQNGESPHSLSLSLSLSSLFPCRVVGHLPKRPLLRWGLRTSAVTLTTVGYLREPFPVSAAQIPSPFLFSLSSFSPFALFIVHCLTEKSPRNLSPRNRNSPRNRQRKLNSSNSTANVD